MQSRQVAVEFEPQPVDHGRVCLQPHVFLEPAGKDTGDPGPFFGQGRFFLDDRREDQRFVRSTDRQILVPCLPFLVQRLLHQGIRLPQDLGARGAFRIAIGLGQEQALRMPHFRT